MTSETSFPHKTLMAWAPDQDPRPQDVKLLKQEVRSNLLSVSTSHGGGNHGHLALMLSPAEYLLISNNNPFPAPAHPGIAPVYAANATQYVIQETIRQYDLRVKELQLYNKVQLTIKTQILEAVPSRFTEILADNEYAYDNVKVYDIINHLSTKYGRVTRAALTANFKLLDADWDPDTCFSALLSHHCQIQQFATNDDPISDATLLMKGLEAVSKMGCFTIDIDMFD